MITVEFKDFEEMKRFAREILGTQEERKADTMPAPSVPVAPAQPAAPVVPVPTTPDAASAVPVQPMAPVVPTQGASQTAVPSAPQPMPPVQTASAPVPTNTSSYTQDDLARAAMTLMDAGRQNELLSLLAQFGVHALPELPQAQYGAFATALRGLGARI